MASTKVCEFEITVLYILNMFISKIYIVSVNHKVYSKTFMHVDCNTRVQHSNFIQSKKNSMVNLWSCNQLPTKFIQYENFVLKLFPLQIPIFFEEVFYDFVCWRFVDYTFSGWNEFMDVHCSHCLSSHAFP